jgi:hypothetical protein
MLSTGVNADEIFDFFGDFAPGSYEWVDATSCNVIWASPMTPARALLALSRPIGY